jgi:hypothetical protein
MSMRTSWIIAVFAALLAVGCGGVKVAVKSPTLGADTALSSAKVSGVEVTSNSALEGDKQQLIDKNQVAQKMKTAIMNALVQGSYGDAAGGTLKLAIELTELRLPKNPGIGGPDRIKGNVTLTDASGAVLKTFEAESVSGRGMFVGGSRASRFSRILSDFSQKVVNAL